MNTRLNAQPLAFNKKAAPQRDSFTLKIKRIMHHINGKFKTMMFEIVSRSESLNITIKYLNEAVGRISDAMQKSNLAFQKNTKVLLETLKDNGKYISSVHDNFSVIDEKFEGSFSITTHLSDIAKTTRESLSVINNITEITNVLALNASIEAAHAGAAGKGFAVVAQEIRKHASTTKEAVDNISKDIKSLITNINDLSEKMNVIKEVIVKEKTLVEKIADASNKENTVLGFVNDDVSSIDAAFREFEDIKDALIRMIKQSDISVSDIEQMLALFQDNIDGIEKIEDSY